MHYILYTLLFLASSIGTLFGVQATPQARPTAPIVGVSLPSSPAVFETSLASPITSSATTMTLTANSVRGGGSISGYACFTLDEGSAQAENVCGTVSSTAVTSLTRGISYANGTTSVSANQFAHRRGANVKITDAPLIQILKAQNNGEDTFENQLKYANTVLLTAGSATTTIPTKYYVDNVATAGCADANTTTRGCVEIATGIEVASTTGAGGTGALTVIPASLSTSTPSGTSYNAYNVPSAKNNGKLHQLWLDLTENFTWSGTHTFNATTSISASSTTTAPLKLNNLPFAYTPTYFTKPSSISISSTPMSTSTPAFLVTDGQGTLTSTYPDWQLIAESAVGTAVSTTTIANIPPRRFIKVYFEVTTSNASNRALLQFNGDTSSNYGYQVYENESVSNYDKRNAATNIALTGNATTSPVFGVIEITNSTTTGKVLTGTFTATASGSYAPMPIRLYGSWANTAQVNRIDIGSNTSNIQAGSIIRVYGSRD